MERTATVLRERGYQVDVVNQTDGELRRSALLDGAVFHSPTVFQLKAMRFHAGFLTERGAEPSNLDPEADVWRLRTPVDAR